MKNMNSKEIIELLEQFGFSSEVKKGKVKFIDSDTWEPVYIEGSKDGSISLNTFSVGSYFAMHSATTGNKIIRMTFAHPLISGVRDQSQVMIKSAYVGCSNTDCDVEYSNFTGELRFTVTCDKKTDQEIKIDINFRPNRSLFIEARNAMSYYGYITGEYDFQSMQVTDDSDLSANGILNALKKNEAVYTFIDYYGKFFPVLLDNLEILKNSASSRNR